MGRRGKGFLGDLKSGISGSIKKFGNFGRQNGGALSTPGRKMGGAWYNNWGDLKKGAMKAYKYLQPVHKFIKDNKVASKLLKLGGQDDYAKKADSYGYGIRKKRSRRC